MSEFEKAKYSLSVASPPGGERARKHSFFGSVENLIFSWFKYDPTAFLQTCAEGECRPNPGMKRGPGRHHQ
ncbi:hypothetical protein RJ40_10920 [Methanofollis aquaemaris]|uniref:Uncharacterized protein n=1 Tax=Methanofollis aquaemaris TaxID=126734 RepID=A0A8A3S8D8_9EURY|nr:hypothetical protein [Methanofollis aquaemaris]QSZ67971.1 hypothetical protein RJ40_10920 [Methanofollis aquaemaris]